MGRIASYRDLGVLVTGASSGIGRECARLLAKDGARLALSARRKDRLEELAEECRRLGAPQAHAVPADLAVDGEADRVAEEAERLLGGVDVLVNNAGFGLPGPFVRSDPDRTEQMLRLNVLAATRLLRRLLPGMLSRDRGGVLNVASMAGFQAAPYQAAYAGTKAFLLDLSESVHQEVKHTGVSVTALCPGVTDTEFFDHPGYRNRGKYLERRMDAVRVAKVGLRGLSRGKMTVVPGFGNRFLLGLERLMPRRVVAEISRRLMGGRTERRGGETR